MLITKVQRELDTSDDLALVRSAKQGDMAAFEQLIHRHTAMIFRIAMHITRSPEVSEGLVQEAFLRACENMQYFDERTRFSTWLARITAKEALTRLRGSRSARTHSMDEEPEESWPLGNRIADWRLQPEQFYGRDQLRVILHQGLASLPELHRMVFLLRDIEGLSAADIAELLGLSVPSVKARLLQARLKLRQHLSQFFEHGKRIDGSRPLRQIHSEVAAQAVTSTIGLR